MGGELEELEEEEEEETEKEEEEEDRGWKERIFQKEVMKNPPSYLTLLSSAWTIRRR
jgi:hypothetical protein